MKTRLLISIAIAIGLIGLNSCTKKELTPDATTTTIQDLNISPEFDWSTRHSGTLEVTINPQNNVALSEYDGMVLDLLNESGERISRQGISNGLVIFEYNTSKAYSNLTLFSPQSEEQKTISLDEQKTSFDLSYSQLKLVAVDTDNDGVDDSVDDYPNDPTRAYRTTYHYWLVFEDLWPSQGDYDFNDLIIEAWMHEADNAQNQLVGGDYDAVIHTAGCNIHLGLGMQWFKATNGYSKLHYLSANTVSFSGGDVLADPDVDNAVIVFDDVFEAMENMSNGNPNGYSNNGVGPTMEPDTIHFRYDISQNIGNEWVTAYIFYSNDRSHEIQVFGMPPTTAADMTLMGTMADNSLTSWNATGYFQPPLNFYQTANHLPWGLELSFSDFKAPLEKTSIIDAYPQFASWAESQGSSNSNWGSTPDVTKVFDLDAELQ